MDENQKNSLAAKKHQIQLRIKVDEFIETRLKHWLEIYEIILANHIEHELIQLANIEEEEISFWEKRMAIEPFAKFRFNLDKLTEKNIFSKLYSIFPSTYPLRFMPSDIGPSLVSDKAEEIIVDFGQRLKVDLEEEVYLMYLYYAPVLKLKLRDIIANAEELYNFPMDDILIASPSFDWIIFRSMEDEWRFCRSTPKVS